MEKSTTHFADEFRDKIGYRDIRAVFVAIDNLPDDKPIHEVLALMNRTSQKLGADERNRLPGLVRQALEAKGHSVKGMGLGS